MRSKISLGVFTAVLVLLVIAQALLDYIDERDLTGNTEVSSGKTDYCIFIEIEDKTLYLLQDGKAIREYPIASGASDSPSPLGYWKIVEKGDWGEGFGGRWLGLNVPWGKYGIHGTTRPGSIGSAASHGCIRMFNRDVKELYNMVPAGTPVVIVNGPFGPFGRGFAEINPGDRGADVMAIQLRLKDLGYFKGWVSGIYDDELKHALHKFQRSNGLEAKNTITKQDWLRMGFKAFE